MKQPYSPQDEHPADGEQLPSEVKHILLGESLVVALIIFSLIAVSTTTTSDGFGPGFAFPLYILGIGLHLFLCFYGLVLAIIRFNRYARIQRKRYLFLLLLPCFFTMLIVFLLVFSNVIMVLAPETPPDAAQS